MSNITKEIFEKWLSDYHGIYVHVTPKKMSGLPNHLASDNSVNLFIGLNMIIPIVDLQVNSNEWSGTLSFNRSPYYLKCPFEAILYVVDPNGSVLYEQKHIQRFYTPNKFEKDSNCELGGECYCVPLCGTDNSSSNVIAVDFRNRIKK